MRHFHPNAASLQKARSGAIRRRTGRVLTAMLLATAGLGGAQSPSPATHDEGGAAQQESASNLPEFSTQEELQTFQVKVNLVEVRVVVRDAQNNAVGTLKQEDFLLFDDKKPQTITKFSVEHHA